ncbi:MAG: hypothetical protein WKF66_12770 [Pedobacter sp.]
MKAILTNKMLKLAVGFFYITLLFAVSVKSSVAFFYTEPLQKQLTTNQNDESEKSEFSEKEKDSKDDLKKSEFINHLVSYFVPKTSNILAYSKIDDRLSSIFQKIPELPPKACLC